MMYQDLHVNPEKPCNSCLSFPRQLGDNFSHGRARLLDFFRLERNSANHRMSAATISLTNFRDVVRAWHGRPWIRAYRDLRSLCTARERDRVSRFGVQVVRNELVEALVTLVNQIKLHHAVCTRRFLPDHFERLEMLLEYRLKTALHFRARRHLFERLRRQLANDSVR